MASLLRDRLDPRFTAPDEETVMRRLAGVPVFCADDVGRWCETVPFDSNVFDIVSVLAPPYPAFWVEVRGVANQHHAHAFGALVTDITPQVNPDGDVATEQSDVRWYLRRELFIEPVKGRGARHAASFLLPLDDTGRILPTQVGRRAVAWLPKPVDGSYELPAETNRLFTAALASLDFAVLMTVCFLNCTNVGTREVTVPPKLVAKHRRRHGRDPISFHMLDIAPMTRALEREGGIAGNGLKRALHLCRGHFKTYTAERPLFGRTAGTFWWTDQARGTVEEGVADKDYRVHPPGEPPPA
ncbi:MAG TPA: hypothetical protein VGM91_05335 [Conexibacter sp.]|jgi:hypothetical protein